ncbi:hypothetical protein, partial [Methanocaldococcus sp.]
KKKFKMNYPDKINLDWFAYKLKEDYEDYNIEIKQIKINGKKIKNCLVIELPEEDETKELKEKIIKLLLKAGTRGMTTIQIAEDLGLSEEEAEETLKELHKKGEIDNPRPGIWIAY